LAYLALTRADVARATYKVGERVQRGHGQFAHARSSEFGVRPRSVACELGDTMARRALAPDTGMSVHG